MNRVLLSFGFVFCISFLSDYYTSAWTNLCPQEHLNELCKCSPGEQCCFCPKPRPPVVGGAPLAPVGPPGNPCESLVIPNGCTVGGTCPSCNGNQREFTSDVCVDEPTCPTIGLTRTICSTFADIRSRLVSKV